MKNSSEFRLYSDTCVSLFFFIFITYYNILLNKSHDVVTNYWNFSRSQRFIRKYLFKKT